MLYVRNMFIILAIFSLAFAGFADLKMDYDQRGISYAGGEIMLDLILNNTGHTGGAHGIKINSVSIEVTNTSGITYQGSIAKFYNTYLCPKDLCLHGVNSMTVSFVPISVSLSVKPGNYSYRYFIVATEEICSDSLGLVCDYSASKLITTPLVYFEVYPEISEKEMSYVGLQDSKSAYDEAVLLYPRAKSIVAKAGSNCTQTTSNMDAGDLYLNTSEFRYSRATKEGYDFGNYGLALRESKTSLTFAVQAKDSYWAAIDAAEACLLELGVTHADISIENANLQLQKTQSHMTALDALYLQANSIRCVPLSKFESNISAVNSSLTEAAVDLVQAKNYYSSGEYRLANFSASISLKLSYDAYSSVSSSLSELNSSILQSTLLLPDLIKAESNISELSFLMNKSSILGINDSNTTALFVSAEKAVLDAQTACLNGDYYKMNQSTIQALKNMDSVRSGVYLSVNKTMDSLVSSLESRINVLKAGNYGAEVTSELPGLEASLKLLSSQLKSGDYTSAMKTYLSLESNISKVESKTTITVIQQGVNYTVLFVLMGLLLFLVYILYYLKKANK